MTVWAVVAGYFAIGVMVLAGPGRREVTKQVRSFHASDPDVRAILGQDEVPAWKLVVFRGLLGLAIVVVWPLLLWVWIHERREAAREDEAWEAQVAEGLQFSLMGGAGTLHCSDCGFKQRITSFTHGITSGPEASCDEGFQCLSCGKFVSVHRAGNPSVTPVPRCECGGELSREHSLFCPTCRSNELHYKLEYIT